jgi:class 3 adenylate cyclase
VDPGLPTGTVTLLFSDIEGSTNLLPRLGEGYADTMSVELSLMLSAFLGSAGPGVARLALHDWVPVRTGAGGTFTERIVVGLRLSEALTGSPLGER